jgi:hypothetical protein
VPRNTRGTLTLSNSDSVYTSISVIVLDKSCTVAVIKHLELLVSKNYVCIIALRLIYKEPFFITE